MTEVVLPTITHGLPTVPDRGPSSSPDGRLGRDRKGEGGEGSRIHLPIPLPDCPNRPRPHQTVRTPPPSPGPLPRPSTPPSRSRPTIDLPFAEQCRVRRENRRTRNYDGAIVTRQDNFFLDEDGTTVGVGTVSVLYNYTFTSPVPLWKRVSFEPRPGRVRPPPLP